MNENGGYFSWWWLGRAAAFFFACLGGAGWMRLFVREGVLPFDWVTGFCSLLLGSVVAFVSLRRWRRSAPHRCAVVVGLCGGAAGAGLVMVLRTSLAW